MKGPNVLLLLFCVDAVAVLLSRAQEQPSASDTDLSGVDVDEDQPELTSLSFSSTFSATTLTSAKSSTAAVQSPVTRSSPVLPNASSPCSFSKDTYFTLLMVTGGLIIACVILLVSIVMLALKVCQMSRRIKSSGAVLISKSECSTNAAKSTPETEAKESTILMSDIGQTQVGDRWVTAEEILSKEEDKNKDGQTGEEGGEKQVGNAANCPDALASGNKETPGAAAESAASPTPQVGAPDSPPTNAMAAPSGEGSKETKEV